MVICHCNRVNDRTIRDHAAAGATDPDEIAGLCGAGARCGGCRRVVEQLLASCRTVIVELAS